MIKLSSRLKIMADQIAQGETVADIGTDHGFLPMYLLEAGISPKVIMADVSAGSLEKAKSNFKKLFCADLWESERHFAEGTNAYDFRLGDGLAVLEEAEVDDVVIAGMGGILMTEIIGADIHKGRSFKKYILQPRNGQGKLRYWLYMNGFTIERELLVREGKFICEVIVALPSEERPCSDIPPEDHIAWEVPELLIEENGSLGQEFARRRLMIEKYIYDSIRNSAQAGSRSDETKEKLCKVHERMEYLSKLLIS